MIFSDGLDLIKYLFGDDRLMKPLVDRPFMLNHPGVDNAFEDRIQAGFGMRQTGAIKELFIFKLVVNCLGGMSGQEVFKDCPHYLGLFGNNN
ncbi:hypothetical protein A3K48_07330 [candidate division WOR-1 bacterium RIFOXYA12_FULL_52_29]|uniref:Uncharacterized protein n=1 Tax=candidate division WOR-1 bacterium RIFOXYC12_FULL_54_18 TaxID=1802584 RepID=A0A1F4T7W8_UNCSA|nr:MAG: hypothetical protein A3K44_07330 [candidate division WOR-1 bacterium RIFOXYA2_FULL_51_19]OGC18329.1 MAG: hypothetical protein A3K48_07330 [candidate division WOR-1 bacterium RIFOXYA12_FULL_52_29]OGC27184.1 MAG: hypothetical protein A3K32_07325 [candidate division WOR-1 bacterium RIFOXYB2_FULL_45_9]OGC28746.1 MAG: hypothetical protein A3K49_07330 [candidate division WOR-1 bacterium RIFOXYC12_FULL_54_18]OGC30799.1 MAG: hypothetical protein A2346_05290 [candidate division WOR-1 bacterium R